MTHDESIPLLVSVGFHGQQELELSFPAEYSDEISQLLDEYNIEHSPILKLSAGEDLVTEGLRVLAVPGALGTLATMLSIFMKRHKGKKFRLRDGDGEIEAEGYSDKQIRQLLELRKEQQTELDAKWKAYEERSSRDGAPE